MSNTPIIEAIKLSKQFTKDGDFVLNSLSLSIPKNKFTAIIGYSGTGKSVFLRQVLGLDRATSGIVRVLGKELHNMEPAELNAFRKNLGVVFQDSALFDDQTVLENVCFPLKEHKRSMSEDKRKAIGSEKLKLSGLNEEHFNKFPEALSGGMKRRVALARALVLEPKILIYDEPTTGLDPVLKQKVDELILTTHKRRSSSTLVVTHDLPSALHFADHIVMLNAGAVLFEGSVSEFLKSSDNLVATFREQGLNKYGKN
ncbi:MAG: ATP-binding cassette domain-containing protein [Bdellovibrionales bacterium]|nr:ATP-binding cassette domain-containing protein [Bdellovibrionales bacterium]